MNLRRKRMILMDGQWYGYLRTASGNPLTLQNAKRLRRLTIYGNAVQDGTPSPDAPVEVQLCGDRTGNLYDVNDKYKVWMSAESDDAGWIIVNYNNTKGTADFWSSLFTNFRDVIEPNTQYTLVTEIEYISGGLIYVTTRASDNNISPFNTHVAYSTAGTYCRTVTSKSNLSDCNVLLRTFGCTRAGDTLTAKFRISLLKGSYTADTLPAYEPYGYKVSGRAEGLNLFDTENIIENTEDTTVKIEEYQGKKCLTWPDGSNTSKQHFMQGKFKENTQYTFRFSGYSKNNMQISIVYTDGSYKAMIIRGGEEWNETIFQSTSGKSIDYWRGWYNYGQKVAIDIDSSMIIEGSYTAETMPPYEPYQPPQDFAVYLPEQIAKVGDVADEITLDFEHKTATRTDKIKQLKDFGVSNCAGIPRQTEQCIHLYNNNVDKGGVDGSPILSTRFVNVTWVSISTDAQNEGVAWYPSGYNHTFYIYLNKTRIDMTADDTTATLATKCNAYIQTLTGREVYYQLLTPVTTDITSLQQWDAMPQVSGTVTLTLSAEVEPSGAEAVYYSKERGE